MFAAAFSAFQHAILCSWALESTGSRSRRVKCAFTGGFDTFCEFKAC